MSREVCFSCSDWDCDDGRCESESSRRSGDTTAPADTCDEWDEIEVRVECSTCRYWEMYRRGRKCMNSSVNEYRFRTKPSECCGGGWEERVPVGQFVAPRKV